jgi:hypothetical protein
MSENTVGVENNKASKEQKQNYEFSINSRRKQKI